MEHTLGWAWAFWIWLMSAAGQAAVPARRQTESWLPDGGEQAPPVRKGCRPRSGLPTAWKERPLPAQHWPTMAPPRPRIFWLEGLIRSR